jgi:TIR domain
VIKALATRMASDDWTTIDMALSQFGMKTSDTWSGTVEGYIIKMIESAKDDDLIELGQHFGIEIANVPAPSAKESAYWKDGHLRVFVSHLTIGKDQAAGVKEALASLGLSCFVAHNDIHPTAEWQTEIENALATCELLIALVQPDFVSSQWCDQEIGYALGRGIPVFTVKCGADPHGFVSRFQAFSGTDKTPHQIALEIFKGTLDHKKLHKRMADIVVNLFVTSSSFAVAKQRMDFVEQLSVWDSSYSSQITKALSENNQISGSWDVPQRIQRVLKKWKKAGY